MIPCASLRSVVCTLDREACKSLRGVLPSIAGVVAARRKRVARLIGGAAFGDRRDVAAAEEPREREQPVGDVDLAVVVDVRGVEALGRRDAFLEVIPICGL